jgi:hypothetical protein
MKKLLVLVLALAITPIASAAFSATLAGDDTTGAGAVTLSIGGMLGSEWQDGLMVISIQGTGTMTSALGAAAPTDAEFVCLLSDLYGNQPMNGIAGEGDLWTMISYTNTYPDGVWIDASYAGAVEGDLITAYVSLDGENYTTLGQIEIIPEPATIALLCLGGLLIRKK